MCANFDDMEKAEVEPLWASFEDEGYTVEDDDETVEEVNGALIGTLTGIDHNIGKNDSRLYTVETEMYDRPIKFWGSGHIDQQVDNASIEVGDTVGVYKTGGMFNTRNGEAHEYEVRYTRESDE